AIRNILRYAKAEWKETNPEWPAFKQQTPFGRLPVLVETFPSGATFTLSETMVIERYLAHKFELYSNDAFPQTIALIEQYRDQYTDVWTDIGTCVFGKDESKREPALQGTKHLVEKHEAALKANGSNGHYVNDSITYIDIAAYSLINIFRDLGFGDAFTPENAPELNKLIENVKRAL
ncbi:hypothetical protein EV182_006012, partial [Spiromyces aspiralis]